MLTLIYNGITFIIPSCCISGPIASVLIRRYGCRFVNALGATVCSLSFILSIFATELYMLYITIGVILGNAPLELHSIAIVIYVNS